jgi:anti-anti-sigma regulatory factor
VFDDLSAIRDRALVGEVLRSRNLRRQHGQFIDVSGIDFVDSSAR